jgi:hypothetical protein
VLIERLFEWSTLRRYAHAHATPEAGMMWGRAMDHASMRLAWLAGGPLIGSVRQVLGSRERAGDWSPDWWGKPANLPLW